MVVGKQLLTCCNIKTNQIDSFLELATSLASRAATRSVNNIQASKPHTPSIYARDITSPNLVVVGRSKIEYE